MSYVFELEEEERQAIVLALAQLSLARPGWTEGCLRPLADKLGASRMFEECRGFGREKVPGVCVICGCTEDKCQQCIERTGEPCSWANEERRLCTACVSGLLQLGLS